MTKTKAEMKKHVPSGIYCHGRLIPNGDGTYESPDMCPWWQDLGTVILHKDIEEAKRIASEKENASYKQCDVNCTEECWSSPATSCLNRTCRCDYLDLTDLEEDTLLWDQCKECNINEDNE